MKKEVFDGLIFLSDFVFKVKGGFFEKVVVMLKKKVFVLSDKDFNFEFF